MREAVVRQSVPPKLPGDTAGTARPSTYGLSFTHKQEPCIGVAEAGRGIVPEDLSPPMMWALDVLDGLDDAGLVCIPAEPTPEMIKAGRAVSGLDDATVGAVFRAMAEKS